MIKSVNMTKLGGAGFSSDASVLSNENHLIETKIMGERANLRGALLPL